MKITSFRRVPSPRCCKQMLVVKIGAPFPHPPPPPLWPVVVPILAITSCGQGCPGRPPHLPTCPKADLRHQRGTQGFARSFPWPRSGAHDVRGHRALGLQLHGEEHAPGGVHHPGAAPPPPGPNTGKLLQGNLVKHCFSVFQIRSAAEREMGTLSNWAHEISVC